MVLCAGLMYADIIEKKGVAHQTAPPFMTTIVPAASCSPLKQGPEEEVGEPAVLSRKCCFGCSMDRVVKQTLSRSAPCSKGERLSGFFLRLVRRPLPCFALCFSVLFCL